jgi:S-DNA-T family DNA segregation ATPase FtsK/SpoIIIE
MNAQRLLGAAAALLIRKTIDGADGQARLLLDRLLPEQVEAITLAVLDDPAMLSRCRPLIPREIGRLTGLPASVLTDERTTFWRNRIDPDDRALLLANDDDEQGQSLGDLFPIGSAQLLDDPTLWIDAADVTLTPDDRRAWIAALRGMLSAKSVSLNRFAEYVSATRAHLTEDALPLEMALGRALPRLQIPRDSAFFAGFAQAARGNATKWRLAFHQAWRRRAPYLAKRHPGDQPIDLTELRANLEKSRSQFDDRVYATLSAFVDAPPTWCEAAQRAAELEWERENVRVLFEGLKKKKEKVGATTVTHFEEKLPNALSGEERAYLERFDGRGSREPDDDDVDFYERHRDHLALSPRLKVAWDRFVFGRAIETDDLRAGLLLALRDLFDQIGEAPHGRTLTIECHRHNVAQWQEVNKYAARYFSRRYRGLQALFGANVEWKPASLFDDAAQEPESRKRGDRISTAKAANQVKFTVRLSPRGGDEEDSASKQLIWHFDPRAIGVAFASDWDAVARNPFVAISVTRETVSAKGRLQSLDLRDVQTFMPHGSQQRGSLVTLRDREPIDARVRRSISAALRDAWIDQLGHDQILARWEAFASRYESAVHGFQARGTASRDALELEQDYAALLDALCAHAGSDKARAALWLPVAELGVASVREGDGAAIVAPWHPLRMVASAVADRRLGGLVRYLLREPVVEFGDGRLFFRDMVAELARPFYPEVCVGLRGEEPLVLAQSDSVGDYTLMESATRTDGAGDVRDETHEDPREAAKVLRDVVRQFLALYPHEAANLSVILYNCDSVGLPEAAVSMLGDLNGDDEDAAARCYVQLRHDSPTRLQSLYEALLEASSRDSDSAVASESSRDFLARLRVGIMASRPESRGDHDSPPTDVVFLQDVVARLCDVHWTEQPAAMVAEAPLTHVPTHWSRHRPSMPNDLHSTTDLCCPVQTPVGWSYLRLVKGLTQHDAPDRAELALPIRRVRFDHGRARAILDAAHRLGQWVVNYDAILTRQHLQNLKVRVIRHRRAADGDRGVIVSSTAPLNMLHTLVRRNLTALGLDVPPAELGALAERLVAYASEVSGDIVLRAARRSAFAHELIGVALSRYLLEDELGAREGEVARGWYFLDDYAEWLGQREGHLADVLAISVRTGEDGRHRLVALVSEAKYVTADILQEQRAHSGRQAEQTLARMQSALFDTPQRLDRDQWLARLADLLAHGVIAPQTSREVLQSVQRDLALGRVEILLRGYSHVFVYAKQPDVALEPNRDRLGQSVRGWQETFPPDLVRALLRAFHRQESPRAVRAGLGPGRPWDEGAPRRTAEGANWATLLGNLEFEVPERAVPTVRVSEPPPPRPRGPRKAPGRDAVASASGPKADVAIFAWATPKVAAVLASALAAEPPRDGDSLWLDEVALRAQSALRGYRLQAKLLGKRLTPNVALLRFEGSDLLTVKGVERVRNELLTTHGLRVARVSAEPGAVVVAVERPTREVVSLPGVLATREVDAPGVRANGRFVVGVRELDATTLYLRAGAVHAPHTLIAGATGSGKSVLLQNLVLDIAMTNTPRAATVTIIDPKQVDYAMFEALPHLDGEIIVDRDLAVARLDALVGEMEERYQRFRATPGTPRDLASYNRIVPEAQRLPVRWVVHDEFADWMLIDEYKQAVQDKVERLGVKARAAGIRLIFAAQRPEDRVTPVQLRSNLGNRLVLRVESEGTSVISLNEPGAERLMGKGHLAARLEGEPDLVYAQVPLLDDRLLSELLVAIRADG